MQPASCQGALVGNQRGKAKVPFTRHLDARVTRGRWTEPHRLSGPVPQPEGNGYRIGLIACPDPMQHVGAHQIERAEVADALLGAGNVGSDCGERMFGGKTAEVVDSSS